MNPERHQVGAGPSAAADDADSAAADAAARDTGYGCRQYAESLAEFGEVAPLPLSGGFLLVRPTPDGGAVDGMGPYPLLACRDWSQLGDDLAALAQQLVAVSAVVDPFADASLTELQRAFPDLCYAYKQHYIADLSRSIEQFLPSHHRRNVSKALRRVDVRRAEPGAQTLGEWLPLYDSLIQRHGIAGIARFSAASFERQMRVPGFVAFAAVSNHTVCGMTLWYRRGSVVYYHLGAYRPAGYALGASYALFATAYREFAREGAAWASLGAGAGPMAADSGLTRFKEGWATGTRPAYFCGRVLQPGRYGELAGSAGPTVGFFPAYRRPAR